MLFGACTWIFGDEPLEKIARRCAAIGLDGIELFVNAREIPRNVSEILERYDLRVLSLTPDNVDLCHPDARTRQDALDYYFRLVDFAVGIGAPIVSCHGYVGRVRALASYAEEWNWMLDAARQIAERAAQANVRVAMELLNRYEAHLLNTVDDGLRFVREVNAPNAGLLLDAYHMNIEEANPADAIQRAGDKLFLFHAADSNRQAVGRGHTDFRAVANALRGIEYCGDIVFECTVPGPDPFTAIKDTDSREQVEEFLRESLVRMKEYVTSSK
ncbi:MAG: sugar phosphate isomerase/epimerase [Chloroflexi bacterium]|nr:sugar phosphate isomerase/epimerase [Chloroflexota bacterium]